MKLTRGLLIAVEGIDGAGKTSTCRPRSAGGRVTDPIRAPFPWFGGKSRAASLIWSALGDCRTYVEPFAGSLAVLLSRPHAPGVETVNDKDGFLANFWRAVQAAPDEVARWADWPVSEIDLTARHAWLVTEGRLRLSRMEADPDLYDAKVAGWWVWGLCSWIGSGWCAGTGPWVVHDGELVNSRKLPHLGDAGRGINRKLPHLGDAGRGINRKLPHLSAGRGINRKLPHLGDAGRGILDMMRALSERLRGVRICCGDWSRVMGPSPARAGGYPCGVLLDPPYVTGEDLYAASGDGVTRDVWRWAEEHGDEPNLRIVVCGYDGDWSPPAGWQTIEWAAKSSYASAKGNGKRERLWCSPACQPVRVDRPAMLLESA